MDLISSVLYLKLPQWYWLQSGEPVSIKISILTVGWLILGFVTMWKNEKRKKSEKLLFLFVFACGYLSIMAYNTNWKFVGLTFLEIAIVGGTMLVAISPLALLLICYEKKYYQKSKSEQNKI